MTQETDNLCISLFFHDTVLAYLNLLNPPRPTCDRGEALLALSRIAWMPQDASPPRPVTAENEKTHCNPIPTEATHG